MSPWLEPKDCIQPLAGFIGSGFLGFIWFLSTIVATGTALRKLSVATHGLFATITTLGGIFFTKWNGSVSPTNGLFWVGGTVVGFWWACRYVTAAVVEKVLAQSGHNERAKVYSLVTGTLLREGAGVAETEALECVRKLQNPDRELSRRALARLHRFVHESRDSAVREFAKIGKNLATTGKFEPDLSAYLEVVVGLYREMLGDLIDNGPCSPCPHEWPAKLHGCRHLSASGRASGAASACPPASVVCVPASMMIAGPYSTAAERMQAAHKSVVPTAIIATRPRRGDVWPEQGPWQTLTSGAETRTAAQNGHALSLDST